MVTVHCDRFCDQNCVHGPSRKAIMGDGLFKRGNIYWIDIRVAGQRYRESSGTHLKEEAKQFRKDKLREYREGLTTGAGSSPKGNPPSKSAAAPSLTLEALRDLWQVEKFQKKSLDDDLQRFKGIMEHFGDERQVGEITGAHIDAWKKKLLASSNGRGGKMAPATVNRYMILLKSAINLAIKKERVTTKNPFTSVTFLKEDNARDKVATRDEYDLLVKESAAQPQI